MKPTKECIEWWAKLGYSNQYYDDYESFIKDTTIDGIEDYEEISAFEGQIIYNQVQEEKKEAYERAVKLYGKELNNE